MGKERVFEELLQEKENIWVTYNEKDKILIFDKFENRDEISREVFEQKVLKLIISYKKEWKEIKKIDLSKLIEEDKNNKNKDTIRNLNLILAENFPILSIWRLTTWHKIVNIRFGWIKKINDNISKEFADLILKKAKDTIYENFSTQNKDFSDKNKWRWAWWNYRDMFFSLPKDFDIFDMFSFNWEKTTNIEDFIALILDDLEKNPELEWILEKSKIKDINTIRDLCKQYFYIWMWVSKLKKANIEDKMLAFYEANISSGKRIISYNEKDYNYTFKETKKKAEKILKNRDLILEKYRNEKFIYKWNSFNIIESWQINYILLELVRKNEEFIIDNEIQEKNNEIEDFIDTLKDYVDLSNDWFFFLTSTLLDHKNNNDWSKIKDRYGEINYFVQSWIVNVDFFIKNYKQVETKTYLNKYMEWKKWVGIFVDIVWNQRENLKQIIKAVELIQKKEITNENNLELIDVCTPVTKRFIEVVKDFKIKYPESVVNLWWDEIFIFIPWKTKEEEKEILKDLFSSLEKQELQSRIVIKEAPIVFDSLDSYSTLNKQIAEIFVGKQINTVLSIDKDINLHKKIRKATDLEEVIKITKDNIDSTVLDNRIKESILDSLIKLFKENSFIEKVQKIKEWWQIETENSFYETIVSIENNIVKIEIIKK